MRWSWDSIAPWAPDPGVESGALAAESGDFWEGVTRWRTAGGMKQSSSRRSLLMLVDCSEVCFLI